ncbi:MAG: aspartyl/asparaginyl beta-hydroxylase domain-containing protein [Bacteroidia bacterium]
MIYLVIILSILLIVWIVESRLLLVLFHKAIFWRVKSQAIYKQPEEVFKAHSELNENWQAIKEETLQVLTRVNDIPRFHQIDSANRKISTSNGPAWKTFILKAFGGWWENNCAQMPETTALLKKFPEVSCAMLSILEPGVTIPPHTGKFKGILRYHLGLLVPESKECFITVNNETRCWEAGAGILFDDTYIHAVQNNTEEFRIILFLNIERKMPAYLSKINRLILKSVMWSPVYFKGKKKGEVVLM